jgi:ParB/RepB/Spo0J family partition protein
LVTHALFTRITIVRAGADVTAVATIDAPAKVGWHLDCDLSSSARPRARQMRSPRLKVVKKTAVPANGSVHRPTATPVPIRYIELKLIDPSTTQPRQHFDDEALQQLAASIRQHGVIQAIVARPRGTRFEVIAGERRVRAPRVAGLTTIPAQVRDIDDAAARQVQIIENLQREEIHPIEEADAYQALLDSDKAITVDILATMVGMSKK